MSKRCVFFAPSDVWGGIEKNVLLRARMLSQRGYRVTVVLLQGMFAERFQPYPEIEVVSVPFRGGDLNPLVVWHYVRLLRRVRPHAVFAASKKDWWLVSFSAWLCSVPNIVLYLGVLRNVKNNIKYRSVFRRFRAEVLVNSGSLKQALISDSPLFSERNVHLIYNGFDLPAKTEPVVDYRKQFGLPEETVLIGCAGRFSMQKGFQLLPDILARLPEHVHVVHAGGGQYEQKIKAIIADSPIAHRVHYVGYLQDTRPFYSGIDVFLLCSRFEGMANVLNEAMSFGKPVVSTRVSGSEELLANGRYGVLVDIDDTAAMADAVQAIISGQVHFDPEQLRQWIADSFSIEQMISKTERLMFQSDRCSSS
ncbi:glycosyltransferase [Gynuella sp.]|uniref:glycosyltransferase n=1 Tax=Gynuella sp. TaxID=2969146 RepID=UPI003D0DD266